MLNQKNNIVFRIDLLLEERNLKRQNLCEFAGISTAALSSLKKSSGVPAADTAIRIANYFEVSLDWLVTGKMKFPEQDNAYPEQVFNRVWNLFLKETQTRDPDYGPLSKQSEEKLFATINSVIPSYILTNWRYNRAMPTYEQLKKLAVFFEKPIEFIAEGIDNSIPSYIETKEVPKREYQYYLNYSQYNTLFWSYDRLYDPDKKNIAEQIIRLFRLRRHIEGRDWDSEWNEQHPTEEPRQLDPNL